MRLIDVDVYCATICRCNRRACDRAKCPIHNAPTAYDIDKVVEELETNKQNALEVEESIKEYNVWNKAIEIVNQGSVSETEQKLKEKEGNK